MNSQNRMNAGGEYVLYRIWATVQDEQGIHPESLFTCLGALAGYACQTYVRQTAAQPNLPLTESPLSVWSLIRRAVQKLGAPLPDLETIFSHVTETVGTRAFGFPQVPDEHRPDHPATFYLTQIWPQILPIAQRFCRKPAQLPVLFGIALQRAIEQTQNMLSPTLSASIAMECAVAMSKVAALPEDLAPADSAVARPPAVAPELKLASTSLASLERGMRAEPRRDRTNPAARGKKSRDEAESMAGVRALVARFPPATRIVTVASLAFIVIAGAMWKSDGKASAETAREKPEQLVRTLQVIEQPAQEEAQISVDEQPPQAMFAQAAPPEPADDAMMYMESQPPPPETIPDGTELSDGTAEMVPPADLFPPPDTDRF